CPMTASGWRQQAGSARDSFAAALLDRAGELGEEIARHRIAGQIFRMPLDRDQPALRFGGLDSLDEPVRRVGGKSKAGRRLADRLMVTAVDGDLGTAGDPGQPRART